MRLTWGVLKGRFKSFNGIKLRPRQNHYVLRSALGFTAEIAGLRIDWR